MLNYINSNGTSVDIGRENCGHILNFLRGHVFVHEEYFASNKYNRHRSLLEYSNTPLEGTNGGLKYGYFAVQPHMKISTSASYMICQDEYRHTEQKRTAHINSCNVRLYNLNVKGSKETNRIVPKAVGEMQKQIDLADTYCSRRIDNTTWLVRTGNNEAIDPTKILIPRFRRVRKVQRMVHGAFECSCPFTTMYGIPCRHVIHVLQHFSLEVYSFNHHDVDVRWWTTYADFVAVKTPSSLTDAEAEIKARLQHTRQHFKLKIGKEAKIEDFGTKAFALGENLSEALLQIVTQELSSLTDVASHPCNYDHDKVDKAVFHLNNMYGGVKVMYGGDGDDNDDIGNNDSNNGCDDDNTLGICGMDDDQCSLIDYTNRVVTVAEGRPAGGPRFLEMKNPIKELFSFLENCDEEHYANYKQEVEDQVSRARRNIISHQKSKDTAKGNMISCMPTNKLNTERKHRKQQVHY